MFFKKKSLFFSFFKSCLIFLYYFVNMQFYQSLFIPILNTIKSIPHFLFSNLHLQVVIIHGKGIPILFRLLIILSYFFLLSRCILTLLCTYFNISAYFNIDLFFKWNVYRSRHTYYTYFIILFYSLFPARLFYLLYFNVDKVVWDHLYDLVVNNREQLKIQFKLQQCKRRRVSRKWLSRLLDFFRLRLKVSFGKLIYYPFLGSSLRIRCLLVYYTFELITTILVQMAVYRWADYTFWLFFHPINRNLTTVQLLFCFVADFTIRLLFYFYFMFYLLVPLIFYLVLKIYAVQVRQVNSKLKELKDKLESTESGERGNDHINQAFRTYRAVHSRLTVFILRFSSSVVSKVIAYYLHYVLPAHAFAFVYFVYRGKSSWLYSLNGLVLLLIYTSFFLLVITIFVPKVNNAICKSGPTLGSIFARKGVLISTAKRRQGSKNWVANTESSWSREAIKLATYYEMVWRVDKELTITAGSMNATVDWKFLWEVSCNSKLESVYLIYLF